MCFIKFSWTKIYEVGLIFFMLNLFSIRNKILTYTSFTMYHKIFYIIFLLTEVQHRSHMSTLWKRWSHLKAMGQYLKIFMKLRSRLKMSTTFWNQELSLQNNALKDSNLPPLNEPTLLMITPKPKSYK